MYILENNFEQNLDMISLFLTEIEANELLKILEKIDNSKNETIDFFEEDKHKMITIIKYDIENIQKLDPKIQMQILQDK